MEHVDELLVDGLVFLDGGVEGHIHDFVVADAYHHVALAIEQGIDAGGSHAAGDDAVVSCGAPATLQVSEDGYADIELRELVANALSIVHGSAQFFVLGYEHDAAVLRLAHSVLDECGELVLFGEVLGDDGCFSSRTECASRRTAASCS